MLIIPVIGDSELITLEAPAVAGTPIYNVNAKGTLDVSGFLDHQEGAWEPVAANLVPAMQTRNRIAVLNP